MVRCKSLIKSTKARVRVCVCFIFSGSFSLELYVARKKIIKARV